jgi:hypothetical protein
VSEANMMVVHDRSRADNRNIARPASIRGHLIPGSSEGIPDQPDLIPLPTLDATDHTCGSVEAYGGERTRLIPTLRTRSNHTAFDRYLWVNSTFN